ncbi:hypothetical protein [Enemella sp. A6]|uniref:hypothetical protein n=1 Tax=Enemella sp. A6 TaxID=3440152 RepID=UPI003EBFCE3C
MRNLRVLTILGALILLISACAGAPDDSTPAQTPDETRSSAPPAGDAEQKFPDVIEAKLTKQGDGFMIDVTISSPYDTPERYADGWRVKTPDGTVLAEHELAHDHANEQPFTRQRGPFEIPDDVTEVVVEGRDKANGYGGETVTIPVPK